MGFEDPKTDYFSNDINIPLIDHVGPILDLQSMSNGWFEVSGIKNITQELKTNHSNRSGYY